MADKSHKHFYGDEYTIYHDDSSKSKTSNCSTKAHEELTGAYHQKWARFTQKLRRIMEENPSLPVVVSSRPSKVNDCTDCDIAYVHDHLTGEFKEKIIVIHSSQDEISEILRSDSSIPF